MKRIMNPKNLSFHPYKLSFYIVMILFLMASTLPSYADNPSQGKSSLNRTSITTNVIKKVFPNGLTLLIKPNYDREVVAINVLARMGPLYESPNQKGISALMQWILFSGGIDNQLESFGASGDTNAFADYGSVSMTVTKSGLDDALSVFLAAIKNPKFAEFDIADGQRGVIHNLETSADQPFNSLSLAFSNSFFGNHPYSGPSSGSVATISAIKRDDLLEWHKKIYIPNNMVITIIGNVDPAEMIRRFQFTFGYLPKGKLPKISSIPIPVLEKDNVTFQPKNIQGAYMMLGYPAPKILNNDTPAMDVLNAILGGGMDSRLFTQLRDKQGLAYAVGSFCQTRVGPSVITAYMVTAPENYQIARDGIVAEFKKFITDPVSIQELEAAKKSIKGYFMMSQETSTTQGGIMGYFELVGYGYKYPDRYPELIDKITAKAIQQVAQKYFKHYVLAIVAPEGTITK
jgi:predicted Zn-dependent peptidase